MILKVGGSNNMRSRIRWSAFRHVLPVLLVVGWLDAASAQSTFFYVGGDRVWSTTSFWRMDYAGTVSATTAPGAADTAFFNIGSQGSFQTTSLTADAAINGIVYGPANPAAMTFRGSGGNRTLTIGTGGIRAWNQTVGFPTGEVTFGSTASGSNVNVVLGGSQDWLMNGRRPVVLNQLAGSAGNNASQTLFLRNTYAGNGNANDAGMNLALAVIGDGTAGGKLNLWLQSPGLIRVSSSNTLTGTMTLQNAGWGLESGTFSSISQLQLAGSLVGSGTVTLSGTGSVRMLGGLNSVGFGRALFQTGTLERPTGGGVFFNNGTVTGVAGAPLVNGVIPWAWGNDTKPVQVVSGSLVTTSLTGPTGGINGITGSTGNWDILFSSTDSLTKNVSPSFLRTDAILTNLNGFTLEANALYLYRRPTLTIAASAGGGLRIGSSGELLITNANDATATLLAINAPITGTGWATLAPSGTLTLSGSNSHTAGTSFVRGTLGLGNPYALGSGTFRISGGSVLDNSSGGPLTIATNNRQEWNSDFTFPGTQPLDLGSGTVSLGSWAGSWRTLTVNGTAPLTVGGRIEDGSYAELPTKGLIKSGSGTLVISGTIGYTGGTELAAGFLGVASDENLGAATAPLLFNGGGLRILGTTPASLGATRPVSTVIDQPFWFDVASAAQTFTVGQALAQTGTGGLVKTGAGVLALTGASTFTSRVQVREGAVQVEQINNSGAGPLGANTTTDLGSGSTTGFLRWVGTTSATTSRVFNLSGTTGGGGIDASGAGALTISGNPTAVAGAKTFTLTGTSTALNTFSGTISNAGSDPLSVVKDGPGTWRLTPASSFTGSFTVNDGTLIAATDSVGTNGAFGAGSVTDVFVGNPSGTATGQAAVLLAAGVNTTKVMNVQAGGGSQAVMLGGTGAGFVDFQGNVYLGRPVTLVADSSGTTSFSGQWYGTGGAGTSPTVNVSIGSPGNTGVVSIFRSLATSGSVGVRFGTLNLGSSGTIAASGGAIGIDQGATLAGIGFVTGTLGGAGLVAPGNSPGILTAGAVDPTSDLDWAFEFTSAAPDYTNPSNSLNDILRLTGTASSPFTTALTSANEIAVYLDVASLAEGNTFSGGFFTNLAGDFRSSIANAAYTYWVSGTGAGQTTYLSKTYVPLATAYPSLSMDVTTVATTATFSGELPTNGQVTTFTVVVPEPGAIALAALGLGLAAYAARRRL
jgi:fibronectin-binding autotransporter adhesin